MQICLGDNSLSRGTGCALGTSHLALTILFLPPWCGKQSRWNGEAKQESKMECDNGLSTTGRPDPLSWKQAKQCQTTSTTSELSELLSQVPPLFVVMPLLEINILLIP